jgi:DNA (cytosine-5)-methyltransferase 3A
MNESSNNSFLSVGGKAEGINVVSMFDGASCGQIALEKAKVMVKNYVASEIKPHAIVTSKLHYPNTIHVGDVRYLHVVNTGVEVNINRAQYRTIGIGLIDLIIGGSPCKGISRLNKNQEGLKHKESILFWEFVRVLEQAKLCNPDVYFLLENTHGNKEATQIITETLGVKPISINSKLVTAQNRPRYYWTNIPGIEQPKDKGITTNDVFKYNGDIVDDCRVKWLNNDSGKNSVKKGYTRINPYPKSGCLTANGHKKWNENYLYKDGVYRYLSKEELEVLQTFPIGYTKHLSYDDAYDLIGEAWTIDIIAHIFSYLPIGKRGGEKDVC